MDDGGFGSGRVLSGRLSDALVVRPWALMFGLVLMIVGYAMALLGLVLAGCAVVGMAYGKYGPCGYMTIRLMRSHKVYLRLSL